MFSWKKEKREKKFKKIRFIAGGSGITPLYFILIHILEEDLDIELHFLFSNKKEEDILLREELEKVRKSGRMTVVHTLSRENKEGFWYGRVD